ncbi:hypothetical protein NDU88_005268, partial [Pleurodeles waltl]
KESSTGPQKPAQEGGPRASSQTNFGYKGKNFDPKRPGVVAVISLDTKLETRPVPRKVPLPTPLQLTLEWLVSKWDQQCAQSKS